MNHSNHSYNELEKLKKKQIIKLVTHSFYNELVNYGVEANDIINVSTQLLDHVLQRKPITNNNGSYQDDFKISDVKNKWLSGRKLILRDVHIEPLRPQDIDVVSSWLKQREVSQTFIRFFPKGKLKLQDYLLNDKIRKYFSVRYLKEYTVGIIGGENIDRDHKKLEMKKFIGASDFRNRGIGKLSTFLFLYYVFEILDYNKIYIHSLDTNIKNININSKFGFELEGILYSEVLIDKTPRDVLRMGLQKRKWHNLFANGNQ